MSLRYEGFAQKGLLPKAQRAAVKDYTVDNQRMPYTVSISRSASQTVKSELHAAIDPPVVVREEVVDGQPTEVLRCKFSKDAACEYVRLDQGARVPQAVLEVIGTSKVPSRTTTLYSVTLLLKDEREYNMAQDLLKQSFRNYPGGHVVVLERINHILAAAHDKVLAQRRYQDERRKVAESHRANGLSGAEVDRRMKLFDKTVDRDMGQEWQDIDHRVASYMGRTAAAAKEVAVEPQPAAGVKPAPGEPMPPSGNLAYDPTWCGDTPPPTPAAKVAQGGEGTSQTFVTPTDKTTAESPAAKKMRLDKAGQCIALGRALLTSKYPDVVWTDRDADLMHDFGAKHMEEI